MRTHSRWSLTRLWLYRYQHVGIYRVSTQIAFSNSLSFPLPKYVICDYYIHKIDLADISNFKKNLIPIESGNLQLEQTKFPVFLTGISPPPPFSLCSRYPASEKSHRPKANSKVCVTSLLALCPTRAPTRAGGIWSCWVTLMLGLAWGM